MDGVALVEDRAGITFGVKLFVPWKAPEPVVYIQSEGVVPFGSVQDVVGLVGRCPNATGSRILRGRDVCSIRVLVPDAWDHNFHDVMIVDMGDEPEVSVSLLELSKRFRQTKPTQCVYCGRVIKCDMHQHVAKFHLDLAQLWRCPVSWCTVWKGNPQDCMDHVMGRTMSLGL